MGNDKHLQYEVSRPSSGGGRPPFKPTKKKPEESLADKICGDAESSSSE